MVWHGVLEGEAVSQRGAFERIGEHTQSDDGG